MSKHWVPDQDNEAFLRAASFVNQTNQLVFLTGKAGTGKTTFLNYLRTNSPKKMIIAAPTGVAAMNAGGMTLHSLFWLPFGLYIADYVQNWDLSNNQVYNRQLLFSKVKLTKKKRDLLREVELLVIDEVSMMRADMLDAIDAILRSVRRDARPFGGLQLLFIGDLFQLPPVIKEQEWRIMVEHYRSPFFFDAHVLRDNPLTILELDKIYRQNDQSFIDILNSIRENTCTQEQLSLLNSYYNPDFSPASHQSYITITSHNSRADGINELELSNLSEDQIVLDAKIKGDFSSSMYPVDTALKLKIGAQVMFIRNDSGEDRKFYNGKIGQVKKIDRSGDAIFVGFDDGTDDVEVKRETWENIQYHYDQKADKVKESVLGTFSQFPLRLAWAITIHKSQGLTFERAIIDAEASFAAGQVYVALSRLTGLQGLVLKSVIPAHSIRTDPVVLEFAGKITSKEELPLLLEKAQRDYLGKILIDSFRWESIITGLEQLLIDTEGRSIPDKPEALLALQAMKAAAEVMEEVAVKFRHQLQSLLRSGAEEDYLLLFERTNKALEWFGPRLETQLLASMDGHLSVWEKLSRTKRYVTELKVVQEMMLRKLNQFQHCQQIAKDLAKEAS